MQNSAPYVCTYLESFITPDYADPLFRAVGYNANLAFSFLDADSRIASEFSLYLHAALPCQRPGVTPRFTPIKAPCPTRSGRQVPGSQATPRRCHSGTEPLGSTPWRRCDGWIHDPIRSLMGALEHPRYSPCALLTTTDRAHVCPSGLCFPRPGHRACSYCGLQARVRGTEVDSIRHLRLGLVVRSGY